MLKHPFSTTILGVFVSVLMATTTPLTAVENFKVSNYGGGHQIWFEVEDFDERVPDIDDYYHVVDADGAFGQAINRTSRGDGMIRWTFDISKAGGSAGTWRFWGRVINPSNQSDFMIVEGDPGDPPLTPGPRYSRGSSEAAGFGNPQRAFDENKGPPWEWSGRNGAEAHTKELQDGENTMYIVPRQGDSSTFWDVFMWTDDPTYVPTDADYENALAPNTAVASDPIPATGVTDVPFETSVLRWTPGDFATTHRVYFGEVFDDVNTASAGALVAEGLTEPMVEVPRTDLGTTYYWRVDEVNGTPDFTVFAGEVWSFTVEAVANLITNVTATADSQFSPATGPENTVNGSGLSDGLHGIDAGDMWQSAALPATIEFVFDDVYVLHEMRVWNHNQLIESFVGFGAKDVIVEVSADGTVFTVLEGVGPFTQAPAARDYAANTTVAFDGTPAQAVRLTITTNFGSIPNVGLSEVQFTAIPVLAREAQPADGAIDVGVDTTLGWRSGRQAERHELHLGIDPNDLPQVGSVTENSFNAQDLDLQLGQTHYWRVDEVNDAMDPSTWMGDIWRFTTVDTIIIDDMERYADAEFLEIWATWLDGFDDPANGSVVGNGAAGTPETDIVHGGSQSMPLNFGNSGAAVSETTRTFETPLDWTRHGVQGLLLYFQGSSTNTGGQLYVMINNTRVDYDGDPANLLRAGWSAWYIPLADVAGDLSRVTSLTLGIDGGGQGVVFVDDISLTPDARELVTPVDPGSAGLMALYAFEGNAQDTSGNGLHGAVTKGQFVSSGTLGKGMSLQLTDSGFVDLGNPALLDFGSGDWTVSAWYKTDISGTADADKGTILAKGGDSGGGHRYALIMSETREGVVSLVCDDNRTKVLADATSITNDNEWHIVVGQREGRAIRIFTDGSLEAASTLPAGYDLSGTVQHNAYLGVITNNGDGSLYKTYEGLIDDVHLYNRALSAGELAWLAGRTVAFDKP